MAIEKRVDVLEDLGRRHERLALDHEDRLRELEAEERRTRKRLHELETDRHALSLATSAVTALATRVGTAVDNMEEIAARAARKAIQSERRTRREGVWRYVGRTAAILGGFGAFAYFVYIAFFA